MLSEQEIQLLTSYVDGELNQRQRNAATRLMNKSSEARALVKELQENAHKVKMLPKHKVEPSLVDEIVKAIEESKAQPKQPAPPLRRVWLPYLTASLAAAILIAVIGFLYWQSIPVSDFGTKDIAATDKVIEPKLDPKFDPKIEQTPPWKPNPLLAQITEDTFGGFGAPVPIDKVFTASFREFQKAGVMASQFTHELNREKSVNVDVTVKSNKDALLRLRTILAERGINLIADPATNKASDDKKVEYLVYAESLTSDEVTRLMSELSQSYVVGMKNSQKTVLSPYNHMTLKPTAKDDRQQLAKALGVEASTLEPKDRKDLKPNPQHDKVAVLVPANASRPAAELAEFAQRRSTQPGTVQVVIRIRQE